MLLYMACGAPVAVSPVGMNADVLRIAPGSGFAARRTDEWLDALERLYTDGELARSMGAAGRKAVEEQFSSILIAGRLAGILRAAGKSDV